MNNLKREDKVKILLSFQGKAEEKVICGKNVRSANLLIDVDYLMCLA